MARVIPIDIIKGISGKYGKDAGFYFATNTSSGKIRISQLPKPSHRPPTEKQRTQRVKFAARQAAVTAWLNANKPSELNGPKGTEAYQHVQRLKRQLGLSLINQVLLKYMGGDNVIRLPETKRQRSCNPHKPKKPWKQTALGNTRTSIREKIGNDMQFVLIKTKTFKTHKTFLYPPPDSATARFLPAFFTFIMLGQIVFIALILLATIGFEKEKETSGCEVSEIYMFCQGFCRFCEHKAG